MDDADTVCGPTALEFQSVLPLNPGSVPWSWASSEPSVRIVRMSESLLPTIDGAPPLIVDVNVA